MKTVKAVAMCLAFAIMGCDAQSPTDTDGPSNFADLTAELDELQKSDPKDGTEAFISAWRYTTDRDEARNAEIKFASVTSSNTEHFSSPYEGGSQAVMTVRKHPAHGLDVYISVQPSQFVCNNYQGCTGLINVDGKPESFSLIGPADYSNDTVFAKYAGGILGKLKGSKKVIVELPFYQEGNRQFTFETAGLEWE